MFCSFATRPCLIMYSLMHICCVSYECTFEHCYHPHGKKRSECVSCRLHIIYFMYMAYLFSLIARIWDGPRRVVRLLWGRLCLVICMIAFTTQHCLIVFCLIYSCDVACELSNTFKYRDLVVSLVVCIFLMCMSMFHLDRAR